MPWWREPFVPETNASQKPFMVLREVKTYSHHLRFQEHVRGGRWILSNSWLLTLLPYPPRCTGMKKSSQNQKVQLWELSSSSSSRPLGILHSPQGSPKPQLSSDSKSTSKEGSDFEQHQAPTPSPAPQQVQRWPRSLHKLGSLGQMSGSTERRLPHVFSGCGEPEDKVSMGSNSYVEKYNSANDIKEGVSPDPLPRPWDPLPRLWQSLKTPKSLPGFKDHT